MRQRTIFLLAACIAISSTGCRPQGESSSKATRIGDGPNIAAQQLDFEALLASVDDAIGKRIQSVETKGMDIATYQYDGPVQKVIDIVAPFAHSSGFSGPIDDLANGRGSIELELQKSVDIGIELLERKKFTHKDGDMLSVSQAEVPGDPSGIKVLTIQLVNVKKMAAELDAMRKTP